MMCTRRHILLKKLRRTSRGGQEGEEEEEEEQEEEEEEEEKGEASPSPIVRPPKRTFEHMEYQNMSENPSSSFPPSLPTSR